MYKIFATYSLSKNFPTGVPLPGGSDNGNQGNSLAVYENRPRIPSHHVRQLTRGKFVINSEDITLLECIGEGDKLSFQLPFCHMEFTNSGEFGVVYKARLSTKLKERNSREVAVKTLKGGCHWGFQILVWKSFTCRNI